MDDTQSNHLSFAVGLEQEVEVEWLYHEGGVCAQFGCRATGMCDRGISHQVIAVAGQSDLCKALPNPYERVKLEVAQNRRLQPRWQTALGRCGDVGVDVR